MAKPPWIVIGWRGLNVHIHPRGAASPSLCNSFFVFAINAPPRPAQEEAWAALGNPVSLRAYRCASYVRVYVRFKHGISLALGVPAETSAELELVRQRYQTEKMRADRGKYTKQRTAHSRRTKYCTAHSRRLP